MSSSWKSHLERSSEVVQYVVGMLIVCFGSDRMLVSGWGLLFPNIIISGLHL
jgi:hypothetical protein